MIKPKHIQHYKLEKKTSKFCLQFLCIVLNYIHKPQEYLERRMILQNLLESDCAYTVCTYLISSHTAFYPDVLWPNNAG